MNEAVISAPLRKPTADLKTLQFAGTLWFITAVAVAMFYGSAALDGDFTRWNDHTRGTVGDFSMHLGVGFMFVTYGSWLPRIKGAA